MPPEFVEVHSTPKKANGTTAAAAAPEFVEVHSTPKKANGTTVAADPEFVDVHSTPKKANGTTGAAVPKTCLLKSCLKKKRHKSKKRVQFGDDVKSWDGPRQQHILLEQLVMDFWKSEPVVTVVDNLVQDGNEDMLLVLHNLLLSAVERVHRTTHSKGAELIVGGGKHGIRLKPGHLLHLQSLITHVNEIYHAVTAPDDDDESSSSDWSDDESTDN